MIELRRMNRFDKLEYHVLSGRTRGRILNPIKSLGGELEIGLRRVESGFPEMSPSVTPYPIISGKMSHPNNSHRLGFRNGQTARS